MASTVREFCCFPMFECAPTGPFCGSFFGWFKVCFICMLSYICVTPVDGLTHERALEFCRSLCVYICESIYIYIHTYIQNIHTYVYECIHVLYLYINIGWRTHIGCLELQVSFRKRATNCRCMYTCLVFVYAHTPAYIHVYMWVYMIHTYLWKCQLNRRLTCGRASEVCKVCVRIHM